MRVTTCNIIVVVGTVLLLILILLQPISVIAEVTGLSLVWRSKYIMHTASAVVAFDIAISPFDVILFILMESS